MRAPRATALLTVLLAAVWWCDAEDAPPKEEYSEVRAKRAKFERSTSLTSEMKVLSRAGDEWPHDKKWVKATTVVLDRGKELADKYRYHFMDETVAKEIDAAVSRLEGMVLDAQENDAPVPDSLLQKQLKNVQLQVQEFKRMNMDAEAQIAELTEGGSKLNNLGAKSNALLAHNKALLEEVLKDTDELKRVYDEAPSAERLQGIQRALHRYVGTSSQLKLLGEPVSEKKVEEDASTRAAQFADEAERKSKAHEAESNGLGGAEALKRREEQQAPQKMNREKLKLALGAAELNRDLLKNRNTELIDAFKALQAKGSEADALVKYEKLESANNGLVEQHKYLQHEIKIARHENTRDWAAARHAARGVAGTSWELSP